MKKRFAHPFENRVRAHFRRIDAIRSVAWMSDVLLDLSKKMRRAVILRALAFSRHQFIWSCLAKEFDVPKSEWPENPWPLKMVSRAENSSPRLS
jgi:hypothetical protein